MVDMRDFTDSYKRLKLQMLAEAIGFATVHDLLRQYAHNNVAPAICARSSCDCTAIMPRNQHEGWCECCDTNSMASAFVWANRI